MNRVVNNPDTHSRDRPAPPPLFCRRRNTFVGIPLPGFRFRNRSNCCTRRPCHRARVFTQYTASSNRGASLGRLMAIRFLLCTGRQAYVALRGGRPYAAKTMARGADLPHLPAKPAAIRLKFPSSQSPALARISRNRQSRVLNDAPPPLFWPTKPKFCVPPAPGRR